MIINPIPKLDFDDVLICPKPSELNSRSEVQLDVSYITKHSKVRFAGLPVCVANMATVGTIGMALALYGMKMWVALHKFYPEQTLIDFFKSQKSSYSFISIGENEEDLDKLKRISKEVPKFNICFDVANLYRYSALDFLKKIRESFPESIIMAGNVATPEGVENCVMAGADIVKCGIGSGQFCETRNKAGIGVPQLEVCVSCGQAARELSAMICSDGGAKSPASVCKALGAGAQMVMVGSIFSGCDENEGDFRINPETGIKEFFMYGMSSSYANNKFSGGLKSYRTSEGREDWIPAKGPAISVAQDISGGLASVCTYINCKRLENLSKNVEFIIKN